MHAPSTDLLLLVAAQAHALLACGPRVAEVLNNSSVDDELVLWRLIAVAGLGDQRAEDAVDDVLVPCLRLGVLVDRGAGDGAVAGVGADLAETGGGDRWLGRCRE